MSSFSLGTFTFLFTDIEVSTKLARAHLETWEAARVRHHTILREAIESNAEGQKMSLDDALDLVLNVVEEIDE